MKRIVVIIVFIVCALNIFSQKHLGEFSLHPKFKKPPYNFEWVTKELSTMLCEVSVDQYCYFLECISRDSSAAYIQRMLPGKECALSAYVQTDKIKAQGVKKTNDPDKDRPISWLDEERFLAEKKMQGKKKVKGVNDYYYNPYSLPVTGISYEQAGEYAKWCTSKLNNDLNRRQKEDISKVFWFRLPTLAEQEKMLMEGVEKCTDKNPNSCAKKSVHLKSCKNDKGCALCNVAEKDTCSSNKIILEAFGKDALYSVWAFNPNWLGLYNLMGNAAEMSAEKGIAKGGSYLQKADDCQPSSHLNYEGPQSWLGFRLVAEIRDLDAGGIWINNDGMIMFTDEQN